MTILREDRVIGWIVIAFVLSQLVAVGWDLPGSYGWENDGIAPRDFFAGIAINLMPGRGHRYPLFHNLLVGLLCMPILLPAALRAESWTLPSLEDQALTVPVMTGCSIVAKLVAIAMACVALAVLARIARRTAGIPAGRWAAVWAATCLTFAYYGRVSNLDGPYLMWTALAIDRLLTIAEDRARRDYVWFGIFAGTAVATKDQAYASFVLPVLLYLVLLPLHAQRPLGPLRPHYENTGIAAASGIVSLGLLGGGFLNPAGFVARLRTLTGGASHDWMTYARTPSGVLTNVVDLVRHQEEFFWPWMVVALCWLGVARVAMNRSGTGIHSRTFQLLPLCAGLSSLLFFTLIVARCEHRFVLPLGFWLSYYGGVGSAWLVAAGASRGRTLRRLAQASLAMMALWAAGHSFEVHLTQLADARHRVTAYLDTLPEGSLVETYGLLVHLPHFDMGGRAPYRVQRVSRRPIDARNPLIGAREIDEPYGKVSERHPDVLVVPEHTARAHLPQPLGPGMIQQAVRRHQELDVDARSFFGAVLGNTLDGYEVVFIAKPVLPRWARALGAEPVHVHESVGHLQWVLRRRNP